MVPVGHPLWDWYGEQIKKAEQAFVAAQRPRDGEAADSASFVARRDAAWHEFSTFRGPALAEMNRIYAEEIGT